MKILFHADRVFSKDAEEFVARRCESAFDRFRSTIDEIRITARDENGPRGGDDIQCVVQILLMRLPDVIVRERAISLEAALSVAVDRAAYQVSRRLNRNIDAVRRAVAVH